LALFGASMTLYPIAGQTINTRITLDHRAAP
jgi:hypothetical protein